MTIANPVIRSARTNATTTNDEGQLLLSLTDSSAKTTSTTDSGVEVGCKGDLILDLVIASRSGTNPTLDVTIETSSDNGSADTWRTLGTFAQQTAGGTTRKNFPGADNYVRANWTIGGTATPTFTFNIGGRAR